MFVQTEAFFKVGFVSFAVCESGTAGLGSADAAAIGRSKDLRLVKGKHVACEIQLKHLEG